MACGAGTSAFIGQTLEHAGHLVSIVENGKGLVTRDHEIEWEIPVIVPMLDIHSVGAGGGSIGWVDEGGSLRVGPQSAGASPGPVCYGLGGTQPTITDAN